MTNTPTPNQTTPPKKAKKKRMTKRRYQLLMEAVCLLEVSFSDVYDDTDEYNQAVAELNEAWQVISDRWAPVQVTR